jgi:hypothetical protein
MGRPSGRAWQGREAEPPSPPYDCAMLKKVLILAVLVALGAVAAKRLRAN